MEGSLDRPNGTKYISLQPFIHQVGGHSSMLCLDESTVCKPVVKTEQLFYENLPTVLRPFVPFYYGIIKVSLIQDGDYITFKATNPENYEPKLSSSLKRLKLRRSGSIEMDGVPALFESEPVLNGGVGAMNPWVRKCLKEYITNITTRLEEDQQPLNFIVLENLTRRYNYPCILDLKMGTRQYGDNDSLAKRQSKMVKVISTTSAKLGVRIGGMQVYQASSGKFMCRNKLYGRTLTVAGFQKALYIFLHNGVRLRTDALPPLIRRLEELLKTLSDIESLRLYTTSLLLLYEGDNVISDNSNGNTNSQKTEANKACQEEQEERAERSSSVDRQSNLLRPPDDDFRQRSTSHNTKDRKHDNSNGNTNSQKTEANKACQEEQEERAERSSSVDRQSNLLRPPDDDFRQRSNSHNTKDRKQPVDVHDHEPLTDVRIIDFAHSTHSGMDDKVVYSGPDSGFLFGLNNTIKILKAILIDSQ